MGGIPPLPSRCAIPPLPPSPPARLKGGGGAKVFIPPPPPASGKGAADKGRPSLLVGGGGREGRLTLPCIIDGGPGGRYGWCEREYCWPPPPVKPPPPRNDDCPLYAILEGGRGAVLYATGAPYGFTPP